MLQRSPCLLPISTIINLSPGRFSGFSIGGCMSSLLQYSRYMIAMILIVLSTISSASTNAPSQSSFWGKLTWDTVIAAEGETRFRYGNWYGPGWWGGSELDSRAGALPPIDALDRVAQKHDFGYEIAEKLGRGNKLEAHYKALADVIAVRDALALDSDPRRWDPPAKDPGLARKYLERIALGFPNYQQRLNELKSAIPIRFDPSNPDALDWYVDGKPPLDENQLEALMKQRVDEWNQDYQKRQINKQTREDAKLPEWSGGAPLEKAEHAMTMGSKNPHWKLISSIDDDGRQRAETANAKTTIWRTTVEHSRGSSGIKLTYLGSSDTNRKVPQIKGASITMRMNWTSPPETIQPDRPVPMKVAVALANRSHSWPPMNGKIFVQIVRIDKDGKTPGSELGRFYNNAQGKPVEWWFESSSANNFQSFDETVYGTLPKGSKKGDLVGIRVTASNGGNGLTSTLYIYQWLP